MKQIGYNIISNTIRNNNYVCKFERVVEICLMNKNFGKQKQMYGFFIIKNS